MKNKATELIFVLDRSGSMSGMESDVIGGYNSMLEQQRKEEGAVRLTTVLFDDHYDILHDRLDLESASPMTEKEYYARGSTALLDAVGRTINKIDRVQQGTVESKRADKVLFVITTDGMENSSREYSLGKVRAMIQHHKDKYGWEFIFLGANMDAAEEAENIGIDRARAGNYRQDTEGIGKLYANVSETVRNYRQNGRIEDDWSDGLQDDE
jgi:Uncharacterized protein encoded in toxicity protection region of plasmid R478, contains von Willebrand factor (vWF) domain